MTKLEKLMAQQAVLTQQINDARKADTQAKKAAAVALAESKKSHFLREAERLGLFNFDAALLAAEFEKIAQRMSASQSSTPEINTAPAPSTFENGE